MNAAARCAGSLAVVAALGLAACQPDTRREPGGSATPSAARTSTEVPTSTTAPTGSGRTVVPPGTTVRHEVAPDGTVLELTVESVETTDSCPARGVDVRPLETFVVLDVTAALTPAEPGAESSTDHKAAGDGATPEDMHAAVTPDIFRIAAPDGRLQEIVVTDASWACLENDSLLPPFVDLGRTVSGKMVLDSASAHGALVYAPDGADGWEWEF